MKRTKTALVIMCLVLASCGQEVDTIRPKSGTITESIYATGYLKSENQYVVFPKVNGTIDQVFVRSGDSVVVGSPIITILNRAQELNAQNANLAADFNAYTENVGKLNRAEQALQLAKSKLALDSVNLSRQEALAKVNANSQLDIEQSQLNVKNSKLSLLAAQTEYADLKRQLNFNATQARTNAKISNSAVNDFTILSQVNGIVYQMDKTVGELVSSQTPIAVIGDAKKFILEMQVDEVDILSISIGQKVMVTLDSYGGDPLEASITKIHQMMDERSRSFRVEAQFSNPPKVLYPNMNFEANILVQTKVKTMLIPRDYIIQETYVMKENGEKIKIKIGLKNYDFVEVLGGLSYTDKLIKPN